MRDVFDCMKFQGGERLKIKVRYAVDGMEKIKKIGEKSDWFDLRSAEDVEMKKWDYREISLGVAMELPEGYEAELAPRSSTFKNFGVLQVNSVGAIEECFCGNEDIWRFPALAMRDTVIHKNDRICQFRIRSHQPNADIVEVEELNGRNRGGLGSTGIN